MSSNTFNSLKPLLKDSYSGSLKQLQKEAQKPFKSEYKMKFPRLINTLQLKPKKK